MIELISALALGSLFTLATLWLYQSMKKLHLDAERQMVQTQNLIVARRAIKNAIGDGGRLCRLAQQRRNYTRHGKIWAQISGGAFAVHPAGQAHPDLKPIGTAHGKRAADSDVLLVRTNALPASFITQHDLQQRRLTAAAGIGLSKGSLVMVCDDRDAALLEVETVIGRSVTYKAPVSGTVPQFDAGATIARYLPSVFYTGRGKSGTASALYRQRSRIVTRNNDRIFSLYTEEIVEGVLKVNAGIVATANNRVGFRTHSSQTAAIALDLTLADGFPPLVKDEKIYSFVLTTQGP